MQRGIAISTLLLACLVLLSYPLSDADLWWHLSAGREMLREGSWLRTDPFCTSSLGVPWVDLHWGFQLLVYGIRRLGGEWGLVVLRGLVVAMAMTLSLGRRISWEAVLWGIVALLLGRSWLELRPLLVSLLLLALLLRCLERPRDGWTWVGCLAVQIGLVNVQGLFLLGPLVVLAHAAGEWWEGRKDVVPGGLALGGAMVAASIANPWGWGAYGLAGRVALRILPSASNVFSSEIPENNPLWHWISDDPARLVPLVWLGAGAWFLRRKDPGWAGRWLVVVGCLTLSLMAVRNLPLLGIAVMHAIAPRGGIWSRVGRWAVAGLLLGACATSMVERRWDLPADPVAPLNWPSRIILERVASQPGPVFHELRAGGWLTWNLPERRACWSDTRLVLHDQAFVRRYLEFFDRPASFDAWSDSAGVRAVLLPLAAWPRSRELVRHLHGDRSWRISACDGSWVLFERGEDRGGAPDWSDDDAQRAIRAEFGSNPRLVELLSANWRRFREDRR